MFGRHILCWNWRQFHVKLYELRLRLLLCFWSSSVYIVHRRYVSDYLWPGIVYQLLIRYIRRVYCCKLVRQLHKLRCWHILWWYWQQLITELH